MWEKEWEIVEGQTRSGGQATVVKVVRRSDGLIGALKQLHPEHLHRIERRHRMQQEASTLVALGGDGVPQLIDSNITEWPNKGVPLYLIMEWIDGPTLAEACSSGALHIDDALAAISEVLNTFERCHDFETYHRDLKPDNVILRNGNVNTPVLVDFGMAWARSESETRNEFETPLAQELGNRFLRLPEYAPGRDIRDPRSDVTMAVGLLFFMLAGTAPRMLNNERGQMPHEAMTDFFPKAVKDDPRWPRLQRVFNVGFQVDIDQRLKSVRELKKRLTDLNPPTDANVQDEIQEELTAIAAVLNSAMARPAAISAPIIRAATEQFLKKLDQTLESTAFQRRGGHPRVTDGGTVVDSKFVLTQRTSSLPHSLCEHRITAVKGTLTASAQFEVGDRYDYYTGPVSDPEGLKEAVVAMAPRVVQKLLRELRRKLAAQFG